MDSPNKPESSNPELKQRLAGLYDHMSKRLGIKQSPKITLTQNPANAKKPFGLTAYYDQNGRFIRVYVTDRHPTDILRSFAHELIHHWQNEHGALPPQDKTSEHAHYAQKNPVLRKREMEAYLLGNILFRDWQDEQRYGPINENLQINNSHALKQAIKEMLIGAIKENIIGSFHRDKTSGDMNPQDFVEEMAHKLELGLEKFIETMNNRGNWENQPNVIPETISRRDLKEFIKSRIEEMGKSHRGNYANWLKTPWKGKPKTSNDKSYSSYVRTMVQRRKEENERAKKYYTIGFITPHYCWYWDDKKNQIVKALGKSHSEHFGRSIPYGHYRGRYDMKTGELSLTVPEYGREALKKRTGDYLQDLPHDMLRALEIEFPGHELFYFPFLV